MDNHTKQTDPSVEYLVQMFPEGFLRNLAQETEFIKRQHKIDPVIFFCGMSVRNIRFVTIIRDCRTDCNGCAVVSYFYFIHTSPDL